ncbi:MAG: DUF4430 domain-containing protein [Pirellulaceae bacterium]|nr:DUF4430 domain-containing protein [Pirellulaceae bacterium]
MHRITGRCLGTSILVLCLFCWPNSTKTLVFAAEDAQTVKLIIDYGDGVEKHFPQLKWAAKITVFELMQQASQHPRGIQFKHQGRGSTVLLTQIDELKNQGGTAQNWIYRVNQKLGNRSIGIQELKPGDTILWKFEPYQ